MYNLKTVIFASIIIILTVMCFSLTKSKNKDLIILKNKNVEVGILPEVGGRVVLFRIPGFENIFKSDSSLWENPASQKPEITPYTDFKAFNGHIVWVGPQNEWWTHQNLNLRRKKYESVWPPDPYIIYGKFEIVELTDSSVKMVGPESPITGVKLYKEISIEKSGKVKFNATLENITDSTIHRDIWMNTRFDGLAKCFVPIDENGIVRFVYNKQSEKDTVPYIVNNGFFTFSPDEPISLDEEQVQEVHLTPLDNYMSAIDKEQIIIIGFEENEDEQIHPRHGKVELYNSIYLDKKQNLLELEVHSNYKALKSGEKISFSETWKLFEQKKALKDNNGIYELLKVIHK